MPFTRKEINAANCIVCGNDKVYCRGLCKACYEARRRSRDPKNWEAERIEKIKHIAEVRNEILVHNGKNKSKSIVRNTKRFNILSENASVLTPTSELSPKKKSKPRKYNKKTILTQ